MDYPQQEINHIGAGTCLFRVLTIVICKIIPKLNLSSSSDWYIILEETVCRNSVSFAHLYITLNIYLYIVSLVFRYI